MMTPLPLWHDLWAAPLPRATWPAGIHQTMTSWRALTYHLRRHHPHHPDLRVLAADLQDLWYLRRNHNLYLQPKNDDYVNIMQIYT